MLDNVVSSVRSAFTLVFNPLRVKVFLKIPLNSDIVNPVTARLILFLPNVP